MNAIELKAIRKALCLSVSDAAEILDVEERSYQRWEQGNRPIPDGIQKEMWEWSADVTVGLAELMEQIDGLMDKHDDTSHVTIALPVYDSNAAYKVDSELTALPYQVANAIYYHLYMLITAGGGECRLVAFDHVKYRAWLEDMGYADSRMFRSQFLAKGSV